MSDRDLRRILEATRTIAVLGLHDNPHKAATYVPRYLHDMGYRVWGVNPRLAGAPIHAGPVAATLGELPEPIDLVDVFRRSEVLPMHVDQLLAMRPLPAVVWFQLGVRHDAVARRLRDGGIEVVQDRCTLAEHRRLGIQARRRAP